MSADDAVRQGRDAWRELAVDRCRITRPGDGNRTRDEATGQYVDPPRVVVYEGACRLQVKADINSNVVETTAGEREFTYLTATLQVPVEPIAGETGSTAAIRPDYVAEILSAPLDPELEGRLLNIQGTHGKTHSTHRRLRVREVIS